MIFPVIELFKSIQGEGRYTGYPSIFIRVTGCNLRCVFNGEECDTPYTSHRPEAARYGFEECITFIKENCHIRHIVITGGEPLLYMSGINSLIEEAVKIYAENEKEAPVITVETNGTLPLDLVRYEHLRSVSLWSISPKLSSSEPKESDGVPAEWVKRHRENRYDRKIFTDNIGKILSSGEAHIQLKFVYTDSGCINEIKENYICPVTAICGNRKPDPERIAVMIMPEGVSPEKINAKRDEMIACCIREGWIYCTRLHITLFGNERGK